MVKHSIGVDLHKEVAQICILDERGEVIREDRFCCNDEPSRKHLIDELLAYQSTGRCCVEAIGMNRWFVQRLQEQGMEVIIADPSKLNLKMHGKKTDRRDAREIARRLFLGDIESYAKTYFCTDEEYGWRKLVRIRLHLIHIRQASINQLRGMLNAYGMGERFPGVLYGKKHLEKLKEVRFEIPTLEQSFRSLVDVVRSIQVQIDNLDEELQIEVQKNEKLYPLMELSGLGALSVCTMVYELGEVSRFKHSKAVAAYVGLVPRISQSADKAHHGRITHRGNRQLRWIFGQWAIRLLSRDALTQSWAATFLKRMHKNKVRTLLARRLLVGIYKMLSTGEVFCLKKCLAVA